MTLQFLKENLVNVFSFRYIFMPWGLHRGLKPTKKKIVTNQLLEEAYKSNRGKSLSHTAVTGLAKQLDWSEHRVEQWYENIITIRFLQPNIPTSLK